MTAKLTSPTAPEWMEWFPFSEQDRIGIGSFRRMDGNDIAPHTSKIAALWLLILVIENE